MLPFPEEDIDCAVGVFRFGPKQGMPVFIADYGESHPSLAEPFLRYRRIHLDIVPTEGGGKRYLATSDMVMVDLSESTARRALEETDPRAMLRELSRSGTPEFYLSFEVEGDSEERFIEARESRGGSWFLVLLAEDATELLIDGTGEVVSRSVVPRSEYES